MRRFIRKLRHCGGSKVHRLQQPPQTANEQLPDLVRPWMVTLKTSRISCPQTNSQTSSSAMRSRKLLIWVASARGGRAVIAISTKFKYVSERLFMCPAQPIKEVAAQADDFRRLRHDLTRVTDVSKGRNRLGDCASCEWEQSEKRRR